MVGSIGRRNMRLGAHRRGRGRIASLVHAFAKNQQIR